MCSAKLLQSRPTLCDATDCNLPGSSVHGILHQEYWHGLPFPPPQDLPDPGIKLWSLALQTDSLSFEPLGRAGDFLLGLSLCEIFVK